MNVNLARRALEEVLKRCPSVVLTRHLSQPKPIALAPCRFQFTLSRKDRMVPNLFLNFIETSATFSYETCALQIENAIQEFIHSDVNIIKDIT